MIDIPSVVRITLKIGITQSQALVHHYSNALHPRHLRAENQTLLRYSKWACSIIILPPLVGDEPAYWVR